MLWAPNCLGLALRLCVWKCKMAMHWDWENRTISVRTRDLRWEALAVIDTSTIWWGKEHDDRYCLGVWRRSLIGILICANGKHYDGAGVLFFQFWLCSVILSNLIILMCSVIPLIQCVFFKRSLFEYYVSFCCSLMSSCIGIFHLLWQI